jgi:hypothetical protein
MRKQKKIMASTAKQSPKKTEKQNLHIIRPRTPNIFGIPCNDLERSNLQHYKKP